MDRASPAQQRPRKPRPGVGGGSPTCPMDLHGVRAAENLTAMPDSMRMEATHRARGAPPHGFGGRKGLAPRARGKGVGGVDTKPTGRAQGKKNGQAHVRLHQHVHRNCKHHRHPGLLCSMLCGLMKWCHTRSKALPPLRGMRPSSSTAAGCRPGSLHECTRAHSSCRGRRCLPEAPSCQRQAWQGDLVNAPSRRHRRWQA